MKALSKLAPAVGLTLTTVKKPEVGHEYVGHIVAMGQEVRGFEIGDRVSGESHITCGFCRNTVGVGVNRAGAFAEYLVIPAFNAFKIPDGISDDLAAIFDPFGNATHTALSFNLVGEDVLITGAGPIGIMAVAIARHVGARNVVITDVNDYRLDLARKMVAMLQSGLDLSPIITHHYPVAEYEAGFDAMLSGQSGKVILDWESVAT